MHSFALFLIALVIAAGVVLYTIWQIKQDVDAVAGRFTLDPGPQSTLIYDSKDRLISALYREHRIPVTLEEMSDPLVAAVLTTEDRRFYDHHGVDSRRIFGVPGRQPPPWPHRPGRQHHHPAVRARRVPRSIEDLRPQGPRSVARPPARIEVQQAGDSSGVPEPRVSRRGLLRRAGRVARLLRQARVGSSTRLKAATLAALINRPSGYGIRKTPASVRDRRDWVLREMQQSGQLDAATYGSAIATPVASTLAPR